MNSKKRGGIENSKGLIIIEFYMEGCAKSTFLAMHIKDLQKKYPDQFEFHEISAVSDFAKELKIKAAPTIVVYKHGLKIDQTEYPDISLVEREIKIWGEKNDGESTGDEVHVKTAEAASVGKD